nr:hypothetical protein [Chamaesiphon sp. VAR_48_metabat_403]
MNANSLLIRHARILLSDNKWLMGDVLVQGERIVEIAPEIASTDAIR